MRIMSATIKASQGAPYSRIYGVGGERGNRVVDNAEMCTIIDSSDEWIQQRTGIVERRWATEDQTPLSMALAASRKAIERSGIDPAQIDAVLVATGSHTRQFPSLAGSVGAGLRLKDPDKELADDFPLLLRIRDALQCLCKRFRGIHKVHLQIQLLVRL